MKRWLAKMAVAVAVAAAAGGVHAQCAGFTDTWMMDRPRAFCPERRVAEEPRDHAGLHIDDVVLPGQRT